jgi:hypothetical protein
MTNEELEIQLPELEKRIPYDEALHDSTELYEQILTDLLNDSKFICLSLLFPFENYVEYKLPTRYYNWQLRACVELYNLADKISVKDYSENGISWSRLKDGLSVSLTDELLSKVYVPDEDDEDV